MDRDSSKSKKTSPVPENPNEVNKKSRIAGVPRKDRTLYMASRIVIRGLVKYLISLQLKWIESRSQIASSTKINNHPVPFIAVAASINIQ
jgi:hypothetical protein